MKRRQLLVLSLLVGLLVVPLAAQADHHEVAPQPITWISYVQSQPGKSTDLTQLLAQNGAKSYDPLMADGHVVTWGVAMPVNHFAGDSWNVVEWVTFRDWAAMDAFMGSFMVMQMAKSPEQMMAEQETWMSLVVPGSHSDELVRHLVVVPGDPPAYIDLTYFPVKPGQAEAVKELWVEHDKATMDKLHEAGKISSFGMAVTLLHDGSVPPSVMFWTGMPNLAAKSAITAAQNAAAVARGDEAEEKIMESFMSKIDFSAHRDRILLVTHNGGGGGEGGEGGGE